MKIFYAITIIMIIYSCNSGQLDYKNINTKDIITFEYDSSGKIIDTLPPYIGLIKRYSLKNIDTTKILVPNSKTALKFARHSLDSIYGKAKMISEKPFNITLIDNKFWFIEGTMPRYYSLGGAAEILISKFDGKVIYVSHGK